MLRLIGITLCFCLLLASCDKADENEMTMELRYIEQACCGNFVVNDSTRIGCPESEDYLLSVENFDIFEPTWPYEFGDVMTVKFRVHEICEASCEIQCNRWNGIPVVFISIENE